MKDYFRVFSHLSNFLLISFCFIFFLQAEDLALLKQKAFRILKEENGNVILSIGDLAQGQKILFVRPIEELQEFEVIANGIVSISSSKTSIVRLNTDTLKKFPTKTDFAVFLGQPKKFITPPVKSGLEGYSAESNNPEDPEPGFMQMGFSYDQGKFSSTSSNRANSYKSFSYKDFTGFHFIWHPEFLPNYGAEFSHTSMDIPIYDYFNSLKSSSLSLTSLRVSYRNRVKANKIRWKIFLQSNYQEFKTENADEYVITSNNAGFGFGGQIGYEKGQSLLTSKTSLWGQPLGIYLELFYQPTLIVIDGPYIQRGSASVSSNFTTFSLFYIHQFYYDFIPWFKKYFFEIRYTTSTSNIKFNGNTKNVSSNFYTIPEGGSYSEKNDYISVVFGLKFEDWFGRSLKPRTK
ncbi:MAG: hypothetical protein L6Q37_00165 [Bdellovibrionaceae bacterium]|nr:hypothetical protein [Pseudobdellovibrionaceae bacterium]NUM57539.1 hypothetical protein [Pseudobdellovibrionaceae bacterium]